VIQAVEEFRAKLQRHPFPDRNVRNTEKSRFAYPGPRRHCALRAEHVLGWEGERGLIQPGSQRRIGWIRITDDVDARAAAADIQIVESRLNRKRQPAVQTAYAADLPASE